MEDPSRHHHHRHCLCEVLEVQEEQPVLDQDSTFSERSEEPGLTHQSQMSASHS